MNNKEYMLIFDSELHSSYINKMFWIAGSFESSEFKEFINGLEKDDFKELLPELYNYQYFSDYYEDDEIQQLLFDFDKYGFIAEVRHPEHDDFVFSDDGEFLSCSVNMGILRTTYVYAENIKDLVDKIKLDAERIYTECIENDLKLG